MKRREFLLAATATLAAPVLPNFASAAKKKPNVVLIMCDDLGYECLACDGSKVYKTPVLDGLAAKGVRFTHCYSQPVCTPSRVKIMTGKYNSRNYVAFETLDPKQKTFGHLMREAGYATGIAGKWQLSGNSAHTGMLPEQAGFDEYCLWQVHVEDKGSRYWNPSLMQNGKQLAGLEEKFGPDVFCDFINGFMEKHKSRPFFAYYSMVLTHGPHVPSPDSKADKSEKRDPKFFPDMVTYTDKIVGRILKKIEDLGLSENTLVIFTGDNGTDKKVTSEFQGRQIKGGKGGTKDSGIHVPAIAFWKGVSARGTLCEDLVDFSDFLPTILEAAGTAPPRDFLCDGRSFLPQIQGRKGKAKEALFFHFEKGKFTEGDLSPEGAEKPVSEKKAAKIAKAAKAGDKPKFTRFAMDKRYKLYDNGRLYDFLSDPGEESPLPEKSDVRKKLQRVLDAQK